MLTELEADSPSASVTGTVGAIGAAGGHNQRRGIGRELDRAGSGNIRIVADIRHTGEGRDRSSNVIGVGLVARGLVKADSLAIRRNSRRRAIVLELDLT